MVGRQDVQFAESLNGLFQGLIHLGTDAHVAFDRQSAAAGLIDIVGDSLHLFKSAAPERNTGTLLCHSVRGALAQALSGAGDDRDFPIKNTHNP